METEKVILRIGSNEKLLGLYNNVKHAANQIHGYETNIYKAIETKTSYKDSYWQYAFIKKEIELSIKRQEAYQETSCLKCNRKFLTRNKRINHICSNCNIINDNIWDNTTIYRIHTHV